jgi:hypothetical protein
MAWKSRFRFLGGQGFFHAARMFLPASYPAAARPMCRADFLPPNNLRLRGREREREGGGEGETRLMCLLCPDRLSNNEANHSDVLHRQLFDLESVASMTYTV